MVGLRSFYSRVPPYGDLVAFTGMAPLRGFSPWDDFFSGGAYANPAKNLGRYAAVGGAIRRLG